MIIREETDEDRDAIHALNERAFGQDGEANLVDLLRTSGTESISLVAAAAEIVGHILFTPVSIDGAPHVKAWGLAPMAVRPDRQRSGIGTQLVKRGIEIARERGYGLIVVVGHPEYYPRFGFERASSRRLTSQWEGMPDDAFMVLVLDERAMAGVEGVVRYRPEFDTVS